MGAIKLTDILSASNLATMKHPSKIGPLGIMNSEYLIFKAQCIFPLVWKT